MRGPLKQTFRCELQLLNEAEKKNVIYLIDEYSISATRSPVTDVQKFCDRPREDRASDPEAQECSDGTFQGCCMMKCEWTAESKQDENRSTKRQQPDKLRTSNCSAK
jgi:hypothetical protein